MPSCRAVFAALALLATIDSTVQNQAWQAPDPSAVQSIISQLDPRTRDSSFSSMSSPLAWDPSPLGDHVFRSVLSSPVTDSDSDGPRTSSGSGAWVGGGAFGADDWQLPPALGAVEEDGSAPMMEPVTEESAGSSEEGAGLRRRCHLCKLMDATRGVAEDSDSGRWLTLVCRHCSQFMKSTIALSTRCHSCRRYANFGPVGGTRRDALHCKRHRQPYEINVSRKRCDYGSELVGLPRRDMCSDVPVVSFRGSRYCAWHGQVRAGLGAGSKGKGDYSQVTPLPSAGKKQARQCIREGCKLTASFGDSHTGAIVCSGHRDAHHVDMIHKKRCEHASCDRNPAYGLPSEGLARFCKEHRPVAYIDLRSRKCQHPYGCAKRPSFGDESDGIARFCMKHKLAHHINVKSRRCQEQGCAKQPTFGGRDDMLVRFCAVHRRPEDVDLVHARCRHKDCSKVALFGFSGGSPQLCNAHRKDCMVNTNALPRLPRGVSPESVSHSEETVVTPLRGWHIPLPSSQHAQPPSLVGEQVSQQETVAQAAQQETVAQGVTGGSGACSLAWPTPVRAAGMPIVPGQRISHLPHSARDHAVAQALAPQSLARPCPLPLPVAAEAANRVIAAGTLC